MRSYPSWIAGLRHRGPKPERLNRGQYCRHLKKGTPVQLVPEPNNRYSNHAVAVMHDGHHLGYIPDRHGWIADALAEGQRLSCVVRTVEFSGWLFRRASLVGLQVAIEGGSMAEAFQEAAEQRRREKPARDACIDGLRVLAFMAMADGTVTSEELNIEISYIQSRLAMSGIEHDAALVDAMLALSQGLVVTQRGLTRAVNKVAADRDHYRLVLGIALQLAELAGAANGLGTEALQRLSKAGKAKRWI
jgi:hypothetical protein